MAKNLIRLWCFSSLVLVSTLDGKLTALDARNNGKLRWSLPAFSGPLLSSSLSSAQVLWKGAVLIGVVSDCMNGSSVREHASVGWVGAADGAGVGGGVETNNMMASRSSATKRTS